MTFYETINVETNIFSRRIRKSKITLNTKVVVISTLFLIFGGMLLIYGIEHRGNLVRFDLKTQYLAAFFQSITLRTAGFNTIDFSTLRIPTLFIMVLFMFIGGASGSTAAGVKVNTVSVIFAYLKSTLNNRKETTLRRHFGNLLSRSLQLLFSMIVRMLYGGCKVVVFVLCAN